MILSNFIRNKAICLIALFAVLISLFNSKAYTQSIKKSESIALNNFINTDVGIISYNQSVLIFSPYFKIGYGRRVFKKANLFLNASATFVHPNNYPKNFSITTQGNTIFNDQAYIAALIGLSQKEVTAKKQEFTSCAASLIGVTINYEFQIGRRKKFSISPIFGANWVKIFATDTRLYNESYAGGKLKSAEFRHTFNNDSYVQLPFGIRFTKELKSNHHQLYLEITGNVNGSYKSTIGSIYEASHMGLGYKYCF